MQPLHNKLHKHKSGWPAPAAPPAAVRCPQVVVMFMGAPALGGVASTRLWPCAAAAEATALSPAAVAFGFEADGAGGGAGGGGGTAKTRPLGVWTRKLAGWLAKTAARPPPAVPHGTQYARHARGWHAYGARTAVRTPRQAALCLRCARYSRPARVPGTYGTAAAWRTCQHTPPPLPLPRPPRPLPMPLPSRATSSSTITWGSG